MQVFQQPVAVLNQYRRYRLGNPRRGAGDDRRPFHIQQFCNVLPGFIDQIFHLKVLVHAIHCRLHHFRARGGNTERGHAP